VRHAPSTVILRAHAAERGGSWVSTLRLAEALRASDRELQLFLLDRCMAVIRTDGPTRELLDPLLEMGSRFELAAHAWTGLALRKTNSRKAFTAAR